MFQREAEESDWAPDDYVSVSKASTGDQEHDDSGSVVAVCGVCMCRDPSGNARYRAALALQVRRCRRRRRAEAAGYTGKEEKWGGGRD